MTDITMSVIYFLSVIFCLIYNIKYLTLFNGDLVYF